MKYQNKLIQANRLLKEIQPYCKKVEIVGDLRRRCDEVFSIDVLAVSRADQVFDLFGNEVSCDPKINEWMDSCGYRFWKNGAKYKLFQWDDVWVNLYLTSIYQWGLQLAIRTGCKFFSQWLVTPKSNGGALPPEMCVRDGWVWIRHTKITTLTEPDFFKAIETEWIRPELRTADVWRG